MKKNITEILDRNGWAYSRTGTIKRNGKTHTAYAVEPYPQNLNGIKPVPYTSLIEDIKRCFKNTWEGKTYCQYAPEIKKSWVAAW